MSLPSIVLDIPLPSRERRAPTVSSQITLSLSLDLRDVSCLLHAGFSGQGTYHIHLAHLVALILGEGNGAWMIGAESVCRVSGLAETASPTSCIEVVAFVVYRVDVLHQVV